MGRQRPLACPVSVIEQELQTAVHALSQQSPATQLPIAHWLLPVQAAPFVFLAVQIPDAQ